MKKLFILLITIFTINFVNAQLVVSPITASQLQLIQSMLGGPGAIISNVTYNGSGLPVVWNNIGTFSTGTTPTNLGITSGLILGTGGVSGAIGPNNTASNSLAVSPTTPDLSDSDLVAIAGSSIFALHDAAILEFDFKLVIDTFKVRYVFGSEEYPEFVPSYNDIFGFFVTGPNPAGGNYTKHNIALIPGTNSPVSIYNVNNGPANAGPCVNCQYYINNAGGTSLQADGLTTVLTASCPVVPCATYHFKLAIADANDRVFDSWVWLEALPMPTGSGNLAGATTVCQGQQNVIYSIPNLPNYTQYYWSLPYGATGLSDSSSIIVNYGNNSQSGLITIGGVSTCGIDTLLSYPVTVIPKPATPTITMNNDTLFSNAFLGNQWYDQNGIINGATQYFYVANTFGLYYDIVTLNGCTSDSSNNIAYTYVGIKENNNEEPIVKLIPNPAKDILTIVTNSNIKQEFQITNILGQRLYSNTINKKTTIDVSAFAKGVYILKLNTDKGIVVKKFIKE